MVEGAWPGTMLLVDGDGGLQRTWHRGSWRAATRSVGRAAFGKQFCQEPLTFRNMLDLNTDSLDCVLEPVLPHRIQLPCGSRTEWPEIFRVDAAVHQALPLPSPFEATSDDEPENRRRDHEPASEQCKIRWETPIRRIDDSSGYQVLDLRDSVNELVETTPVPPNDMAFCCERSNRMRPRSGRYRRPARSTAATSSYTAHHTIRRTRAFTSRCAHRSPSWPASKHACL